MRFTFGVIRSFALRLEGIAFSDQNKNLEKDQQNSEDISDIAFGIIIGEITEPDGLDENQRLQLAYKNLFTSLEFFMNSFARYFLTFKGCKNRNFAEWLEAAIVEFDCQSLGDYLVDLHTSVNASELKRDCSVAEIDELILCLGEQRLFELGLEMIDQCKAKHTREFIRISTMSLGVKGFLKIIENFTKIERLAFNSPEPGSVLKRTLPKQAPKKVKIFDFEAFEAVKKECSHRSRHADNINMVLNTESELRDLVPVDSVTADAVMDLKECFPNFSDVIDYVSEQIALSQMTSDKAFNMQPVLLVGPPGVGKTVFTKALAYAVGINCGAIDMASITSGFVIAGSSHRWADGGEGVVLNILRTGQFANPILLLDEIDKVGVNMQHDPLGPLYGLLEKETAKNFIDEGVGVPIDASNVVWMATANSLDNLPKPILSRFSIVLVEQAKGDDARVVVQSVWTSVRSANDWGQSFEKTLNNQVLKILADKEPREVKRLLLKACGFAARHRVVNDDVLALTVFDFKCKNVERSLKVH